MRQNNATVNGLNCHVLGTANSTTFCSHLGTKSGNQVAAGMSIGIRVWKRSSGSVETEITGGAPVAVYTRNTETFGTTVSATYACPLTALVATDSIVVRVYRRFAADAWVLLTTFQTEQLGAQSVDVNTWTVYYGIGFFFDDPIDTHIEFYHGISYYVSRAEGFKWTAAALAATAGVMDGLVCISMLKRLPGLPPFPFKNLVHG